MCISDLVIDALSFSRKVSKQKFRCLDLIEDALSYNVFMLDVIGTYRINSEFTKASFYGVAYIGQLRFIF